MMKNKFLGRVSLGALAAASFFAFGPVAAHAAGVDQLQSELNSLQRQITLLKSQQQTLTQEQMKLSTQAKQQQVISMQQAKFMQDQLRTKNKATWYLSGDDAVPSFVSNDGASTFELGGDIQLNAGVGTVPRPGSTTGGLNRGGFSGGTNFRRIELEVAGIYAKHYVWEIQYNFAATSTTVAPLAGIETVEAGYTGATGSVTNTFLIGNQSVPFGDHTGSPAQIFLENDMPNTIWQPGRQLGISGRNANKYFNAWYGFFGPSGATKTPSQETYLGNSQYTATGTFAVAPINTPGHLVQLRLSALYNKFNSTSDNGLITANEPSFTSTPDANIYGTSFVNTGAMALQSDTVESPRLQVEYNRFNAAASYTFVQSRSNAFTSTTNHRKLQPSFSGWEVEAQYFLTPDHEPYSTANGYFVNVRPTHPVTDGGIGAIGLTARVDNVNLNNQRYLIHGGNETNLTLGVNWWPTDNTRINLNYIKVFPVTGGGAGYTNTPTPGTSIYRKKNASILGLYLEFIY